MALLISASQAAWAAEDVAPVNDNCSGAIALTLGGSCTYVTGDVADATQSLPAITCNTYTGDANDDVWYSFVATTNQATIQVEGSVNFDPVVELLSGVCGSTVSLACADATFVGGTEAITYANFNIGQTYRVRVYDYYNTVPASTTFGICVWSPTPPPNDECSGAVLLTPSPECTLTAGDVAGATWVGLYADCWWVTYGLHDVWYKFVATDAHQRIEVYPTPDLTPEIELFTGTCGALVAAGCWGMYIEGIPECYERTDLVPGETYYFRVWDDFWELPLSSAFSVGVRSPAPNDACVNAIQLAVGPDCAPTSGSGMGATLSQLANCGASVADDDVWYTFTATGPTITIEVLANPLIDPVLELFQGTCAGSYVACANNGGYGDDEVLVRNDLVPGAAYSVRVYDNGQNWPETGFQICVHGADCNGVPGGTAYPGNACDDGILASYDDQYDLQCQCVGFDCAASLGGFALPGTPCDDQDPWTSNEYWTVDCACVGVVGIDGPLPSQSGMTLVPNPSHAGMVLLSAEGEWPGARVEVLDLAGRMVHRRSLLSAVIRNMPLELAHLDPGHYMVRLICAGRCAVQRLVVE